MALEIGSQLDLQKKELSHPDYIFTKLLPQQAVPAADTANGNGILTASGGTEITFQLYPGVINLSKSVLRFSVSPNKIGATTNNWMFMDVPLAAFQQIQLMNQAGVLLCDLQQPHAYSKVVSMAQVSKNDFLNYDTAYSYNATAIGSFKGLKPSNGIKGLFLDSASTITPGTVSVRPVAYDDGSGSTISASVSYIEKSYLEVSTATQHGPAIDYSLQMNLIKNTIFEIDKDLYFPETMVLRLVWNPLAKVAYYNTASATDPTGGTPAALTSCNVTNLAFYVAQESNQMIINQLKEKVLSSGISFPVPFVYSFKTATGATSTQGSSIKLTRGNGRSLLKMYHSIFPISETLNAVYNNSVTSTSLANFWTQYNGVRKQQFNVTLLNKEDWILMEKLLEGSLCNNLNVYRYNWFWVDIFDGTEKLAQKSELEDNEIKGLPLDQGEVRMDFTAQTAATAFNHYDFAICQKIMSISAAGVQIS